MATSDMAKKLMAARTAGRQVFGAVTRADTNVAALIRRTIETVGRDDDTEVTAFTDGCPGLRTILANAGVTKPPILDWSHIAMRLQHTTLAAANLSTDDPDRVISARTRASQQSERLVSVAGRNPPAPLFTGEV
jgi:hypothetical protein